MLVEKGVVEVQEVSIMLVVLAFWKRTEAWWHLRVLPDLLVVYRFVFVLFWLVLRSFAGS